ncbi:MAG TPA: hypothetical protein VN802_23930 [Stellaceae bacterium]|nr:hypothetical protein [Stellaceae bacterium]
MSKLDQLIDASRGKAQDLFARDKKDSVERLSMREKERRADAEKTARLRELRLAKEAADAAAPKPAAPARRKKPQ